MRDVDENARAADDYRLRGILDEVVQEPVGMSAGRKTGLVEPGPKRGVRKSRRGLPQSERSPTRREETAPSRSGRSPWPLHRPPACRINWTAGRRRPRTSCTSLSRRAGWATPSPGSAGAGGPPPCAGDTSKVPPLIALETNVP